MAAYTAAIIPSIFQPILRRGDVLLNRISGKIWTATQLSSKHIDNNLIEMGRH